MRICVDVRCLMAGRKTGVEEYTLNLLLSLLEIDKKNSYVLFLNSWKTPRFDFSVFEKYPHVQVKRLKIPNKLLNLSFWYLGFPKIDRLVGGADVVFSPNIIFGATSKKSKLIVTIHDLSFERYPQHFSWKRRFWHIFINSKKICQRADRIMAVSESTKNDIVRLYGVSESKIWIVPSAVLEKFKIIDRNNEQLVKTKEKYNLPYKFILYLGTIEPRKNITGLVRAYDQLQKNAQDENNEELGKYKLIIAGESGWLSEKIFREIEKARFRDKIQIINFVEDQGKEYVYNLSSLFVYPSFFEGFGFPPLEAMRCGIPVIASNNSSLPEVVGKGGILIDPDKPDEIYRAIKNVLTDKELRDVLVKRGLEKAEEFDWKKTAQKFLKIIG